MKAVFLGLALIGLGAVAASTQGGVKPTTPAQGYYITHFFNAKRHPERYTLIELRYLADELRKAKEAKKAEFITRLAATWDNQVCQNSSRPKMIRKEEFDYFSSCFCDVPVNRLKDKDPIENFGVPIHKYVAIYLEGIKSPGIGKLPTRAPAPAPGAPQSDPGPALAPAPAAAPAAVGALSDEEYAILTAQGMTIDPSRIKQSV